MLATASVCFPLIGCAGKPAPGDGNDLPPPIETPPDEPPTVETPKPLDRTDIYINDADDKPIPPPYEFDDSEKYDYAGVTYLNKVGSFIRSGGTYTAYDPIFNVSLNYTPPFPYGTLSCTVRSNDLVDTGLLFGVSDCGAAYDDAKMSYYYYFLGMGGYAYLGKWVGATGTWSCLKNVSVGTVDPNKDYKLKVVLKGNYMVCYMDDEIMFGFKDKEFLTGTGYGLRITAHPDVNSASSAVGVSLFDIVATSEYDY